MKRVLKALRIANDYSIKDLAAKLGVSPSHISRIESGEKIPSEELIKKYSEVLKVRVSTIKFFSTEENKKNLKYQELLLLVLQKMCGKSFND